jgi:hypothetical protein
MTKPPSAELGPVRRLQVLAASIPGAAYDESVVYAPFDELWAVVSDMDTSIPVLFPNFPPGAPSPATANSSRPTRTAIWGSGASSTSR